MFISTSSAFGFALEILCWIFVSCIILFYMIFDIGASGAQIGLVITQAMSLSGVLQWGILCYQVNSPVRPFRIKRFFIAGVRQSAEVSNQLTSVERVLEYRDLEPEKEPNQPHEVSTDWPQNGTIEFRKIIYRYFAEAEPVLRELSFTIQSREKIGKF